MLQHLLVLPDGTEICSGKPGSAVMAVSLTWEVNDQQLLAPGATVAAMVQLSLLLPEQTVRAGDRLELYNGADRSRVGIFIAQEPVYSGGLVKITAYDQLILLDRDVTALLQSLQWPCSLGELAAETCRYCGLELVTREFPSSEFSAPCPTGDGITGRQLMMWIAQAAGCFCRATAHGAVELGWYTPAEITVGAEGVGCLSGVLRCSGKVEEQTLRLPGTVTDGVLSLRQQYIRSGGLQLETDATIPIDRVQLRQTEADVGILYPDAPGENTLVIQGNPLLAAEDGQMLLPVAEALYERFGSISYTPGTVKLPTVPSLEPGQLLQVIDRQGNPQTLYVMRLERTVNGDTVTCTGSYSRDSATVVNNRSYKNLHGRVLQLRTDVEGIWAENSDNRGKLAQLQLEIEGIRGSVSTTEGLVQKLTALEQTAQGLQLSVEQLRTEGTEKLKTAMGYTFDDRGLRIARSGQQMENLLDNTGMRVTRSGKPILQADQAGVAAVDVSVRNYLIMGDHARFENYTAGRTACFWLEG